jgi:hypothetical protein
MDAFGRPEAFLVFTIAGLVSQYCTPQ